MIVQEYNDVWKTTSQSALNKISVELSSKNIPKQAVQIILRAMAENNEQKLCELLMKGFEDKLSPIANLTWKSNYSITYPN